MHDPGGRGGIFRRILGQPTLRPFRDHPHIGGGHVAHVETDAHHLPTDIDLIGQVHAVANRKLIEEEVLRRLFRIVRDAHVAGVIPMHVHVQPLHRVRQRADIHDLWLITQPIGEIGHRLQVFRVVDPLILAAVDRELQQIHARQTLFSEIRIAAELVAFIEILDKIVLQLQLADPDNAGNHDRRAAPEQGRALVDHKIRQAAHRGGCARCLRFALERQDDDQRGQQRQRVEHRRQHAEPGHIAKLTEWR